MASIPPEIWFYIAKFIPNEELRNLLGVNSIFFDIGMDIRYKEVQISTKAINQTLKILKRLRSLHFTIETLSFLLTMILVIRSLLPE